MKGRSSPLSRLVLSFGAALALGCAPEFDEVSELTTLRVLGVQKDKPYAQPGDDITLRLLWHDGSGEEREVQRAWLVGEIGDTGQYLDCVNPEADSYADCIERARELIRRERGGERFAPSVPLGDEITVRLEDPNSTNPVESVQREFIPGQPGYGVMVVFFAVCAGGQIVADPEVESLWTCRDAEDDPIGPENFVLGYTSIYSFGEIAGTPIGNTNPVVTGFQLRGEPVTHDCIGADCIGRPIVAPDCSEPGAPCVPACEDDGEPSCEAYDVQAVVDPLSVEDDDVAELAYRRELKEQMWANYYVDRGDISSVKLVNDATEGFNDEQAAEFRAPKEPGPVTIWSVVHDNRGGTDFVRFTLGVQ